MYRNTIKVLLIFFVYNFVDAKNIGKIQLLSVTSTEIIMRVEIKPSVKGIEDTGFIGISLSDGVNFKGIVTFNNGNTVSLIPVSEGWMGEDYVRWFYFTTGMASYFDTVQYATVKVILSSSALGGISEKDIEFSNGILKLKNVRNLYKVKSVIPVLPFTKGIRIEVDRDGIYQISGRMLKEKGVPIAKIDAKTYQLFCKGREIPLYIPNEHHKRLEEDDLLLFYGEKLRKDDGSFENYSFTNVYWLIWEEGIGSRISVVSGGRRKDNTVYSSNSLLYVNSFYDTLHLEEDNTLVWLGNITDLPPAEINVEKSYKEDIDMWYWGYIGGSSLVNFNFTLSSPLPKGYAKLVIGLMGLSSIDSIIPDHNMQLYINDKVAGKNNNITWDGQRSFVFETDTFSSDYLVHGKNLLTFHLPSPFSDRSALNWIKVIYLRGYEVIDDCISFNNISNSYGRVCEYNIKGFTSEKIELWDVKRNLYFRNFIVERGSGRDKDKFSLIFQDSVASAAKYFAQCIDKRLVPLFLSMDTIKTIWDTIGFIDYIAIGADSLREDLEPLLKLHKERGLKTFFASIKDIYNRFSWGIADPESIKNFLKFLANRFGKLPKYLLLGGDTTHDLDKQNRNRNIVPTHISLIPGWGPAADDGYFSLLKGEDLFPDICIGRFPAQNRDEMRAIVEKTVKYIKEPLTGFWRDNILLLSGIEHSFTEFTNEVTEEIIEEKMSVTRIDADPESYFYKDEYTAPKSITDCINSGVFLINFNGHGGGNIWSDNNFFSYTNLPFLHNGEWSNKGKYPVVFSFTCLTGFFESSEYRSLGEEFIRLNRNGTVAFYGASAYTSQQGNFIMNKIMLRKALEEENITIGELVNLCEIEMLLRNREQYLPLVNQYNLLGDPALPWKLTPDTLKFTKIEIDSENIIHIEGECEPIKSGEVKVSFSSGLDIRERAITSINDGKFSNTIKLKNSIKNITGEIRAYAWNDSVEVRGWQKLVKDTLVVTDITTEPTMLSWSDSVLLSCHLAGFTDTTDKAVSVYCLYTIGRRENPQLSFSGIVMERKGGTGWTTISKIPLKFSGETSASLIVKIRTVIDGKTAESRVFILPIKGLPDLMFKNNSLSVIWEKDSFFIYSEVINGGTEAAPPFSIVYFWRAPDGTIDTLDIAYCKDSLLATQSKDFFIPLPDTTGALQYEALINPSFSFREIFTDNNRAAGKIKLFFKDIKEKKDTLTYGNMKIYPSDNLNTTYRIYVVEDTINKTSPLSTKSKWRALANSFPVKWSIRSRPSFPTTDTFICSWEEKLESLVEDTLLSKSDIMVFDTLLKRWKAAGGKRSILENSKILISAKIPYVEIFSVADIEDIIQPEISATSYGKSLDNLEYRANDRPLTIFLADPSGILPSSIEFFLNKNKVSSSMYSSLPSSGDLQNITISFYPERMEEIDSLHIVCCDLAGNRGERTFAYISGGGLSIKSFTCHPNPFTAKANSDGSISKIRFLFLLSDLATTVNLSIYTASGKKIKSWILNELIGLNMVEWDGRDENGFRIANGTYYAKLIAKNDKKKVKKIIRIAKLEGF